MKVRTAQFEAEGHIVSTMKEKYKKKKKIWKGKIEMAEKEAEKWERMAKFTNQVRAIKKESVQTVYGESAFVQ